MPPKVPVAGQKQQQSNKRKEPPTRANGNTHKSSKRPRNDHASKARDARQLATQPSFKAFKHGELDVDKFVKSREYEIRALEQGLVRSKKALTKRAFQQVPKELRRRTASHNAKRIPKRLRDRGKREMVDDNTPTVTARRRKPTGPMRLRLETAKKLRALGSKRKAANEKAKEDKVTVRPIVHGDGAMDVDKTAPVDPKNVLTRAPKVKKATLANPPTPKAKFRKRQIHKSWLPTHLYHAKRARMTLPKEPLWRFAIPLTPTAKSYRPTHRAASDRGAICWDVSYMSTISLSGREASIAGVLRAMGAGEHDSSTWGAKGSKWLDGKRALGFLCHEREAPHVPIAPLTVLWCAPAVTQTSPEERAKSKRQALLRVHPSAFLAVWEEVLRLAKIAKPAVMVEDLRFEMGSIDVTGPASTEALLSALWPSNSAEGTTTNSDGSPEKTFSRLSGLTNPALLPAGTVMAFDIQDPRLHHPPRPVRPTTNSNAEMDLLELIAAWPPDTTSSPATLFDRKSRLAAASSLPSQKAINRRRALAPPGDYPSTFPQDPRIPTLIYTSPSTAKSRSQQSTYHVLLPWKCVQPVWYSLMYTPLSTGQQPRFGGLDEQRQLAFERGEPWFPGDFPGTKAGWEWESEESKKRWSDWDRRPKAKRTSWEAVDLGAGQKGEVGQGWACDWTRLVEDPPAKPAAEDATTITVANQPAAQPLTSEAKSKHRTPPPTPPMPKTLTHIPSAVARRLLDSPVPLPAYLPPHALISIRVSPLSRGLPRSCARIYRLPTNPPLRTAWLATQSTKANQKTAPMRTSELKNLPDHVAQARLAQSLLAAPRAGEDWPACPGEEDLLGFVTSGNYDLGGGKGVGIGCVLLHRVVDGTGGKDKEGEKTLCIVRNAGESVARLANWEIV